MTSYERREEFADVARQNVTQFFGGEHPAWELRLGDLAEGLEKATAPTGSSSDMLAPWDAWTRRRGPASRRDRVRVRRHPPALLPRFVETVRLHGGFTEPQPWESLVRDWHVEGLAVRPGTR